MPKNDGQLKQNLEHPLKEYGKVRTYFGDIKKKF